MRHASLLASVALAAALSGCGGKDLSLRPGKVAISEVARSDRQWTGVAASCDGRLFASYPRWSPEVPISVAEIVDGQPVPLPNEEWNSWDPAKTASNHWVCVQSIVADATGGLWVLDPASPGFQGVVPNGPKLVRIDLATNRMTSMFMFGPDAAPPRSYLNDVRFDFARNAAFITDSGIGAIVVLDLKTGKARRLLEEHPSTQSEDIDVVIAGQPVRMPDGAKPQVHSDGLALDPSGEFLYYIALTGRTLYRVPTAALLDASLSATELAEKIERVAEAGPCDGIEFAPGGELLISGIEENAIMSWSPAKGLQTLATHPDLHWPDSFAVDCRGNIFVTSAQIHFWGNVPGPYRIWSVAPAE